MNQELTYLIVAILLIALLVFILKKEKEKSKSLQIKNINTDNENKALHVKVTNYDNQIIELAKVNESLVKKVESLSRYEGVVEIEALKENIIKESIYFSNGIRSEAAKNAYQITEDARERLKIAREQATLTLKDSKLKLERAISDSVNIIKNAEEKAEEIAGSAYKALKDADAYEQTAKAMKNIIKGYGDEYLKPTFSLLDQLAEDFSHTDAGENLRVARNRTNAMSKSTKGADCDYAEASRRHTAVIFVLDAFNGKVDSIMSTVKKDNYGTLEQKIKDSFNLVNNNGRSFRNARITKEYLESRLDELKWAVILQELKWEEREEQRIIREQIREEEKVRREIEKALKEAEKEEALLKKLIEKAQKDVAKANEAEKANYLDKLADLEAKLLTAEEKNKRALSMAQQTKAGNVYVISNIGSFGEDVFKIGMTRRLEPLDRIRELGDASVPFEFDVHAMIYSENAPTLERDLHKKFLKLQLNKINPRKEFFKVSLTDIRNTIEDLGIKSKWTMTAEAKQYRESIALAKVIKEDKLLEQQWEQYQEDAEAEIMELEQNELLN